MTNIKMIYFDSVAIDSVTFESRLSKLCISLYVIKEGIVIVNYNGSSKELFCQRFPNSATNNIFIVDLDAASGSYWGFMNKELWTWLSNNHQ